jgi:hypothetical protein
MTTPRQILAFLLLSLFLPSALLAETMATLAADCMLAVEAGDDDAFTTKAAAMQQRKDTFDTMAMAMAEQCLSQGYGEPWIYYSPAGAFMSVADREARLQAGADARQRAAKAEATRLEDAAFSEAARKANSERVSAMVYTSCAILLSRDQIGAMTNAICVESFLTNGLPAD